MSDESAVVNSMALVYASEWPEQVSELLFAPAGFGTTFTLDDADDLIGSRIDGSVADALLPLCLVDEASVACVVTTDELEGLSPGSVVRLHLADVPDDLQLRLLDVDPLLYVHSLAEELGTRQEGLDRVLDEIGPAYQEAYLEKEKRPRDFIIRPVRIACQNVIVALGAIAQDASFDGLSVVAWQACEAPHVVTHEANRALAALMLADAFQNGGTMEIRFDRSARVLVGEEIRVYEGHPEGAIPASLRRFGRTVGVILGGDDPASISPAEARALFLAITPMPASLHRRVIDATERRGITPERLCFTLLSQIWREIELDFILGCSSRAGSILEGGADWQARSARQAEMDTCRAALMTGMLFRRINGRDSAGVSEGPRVVEDVSVGVSWEIIDRLGAVSFTGLDGAEGIPWGATADIPVGDTLIVFPRTFLTDSTIAEATRMHSESRPVVIAVARDAAVPDEIAGLPVLRCPDRIADLDKQAEARLLTSRISRS